MRQSQDATQIFSSTAKLQLAFTAATTDIITATAHALTVGDCLQFTTTTTLPAGLSLLTNYYVIEVLTANTFKVSATPGGTTVDITDTGTGTHTYHLKGKVVYVGDFKTTVLSVDFSGTPTMTVKFQGSSQDTAPDFNTTQSATNSWDYVNTVDYQNNIGIDGDDGISVTGSNDNRVIEINTNGLEWITAIVTSWTDGEIGISAKPFATI